MLKGRGGLLVLFLAFSTLMLSGCVSRYTTRTPQRDALVEEIHRFKGTPYLYGGSTPRGTDCSGFTMTVFKQFGVNLPHGATSQSKMGKPVSRSELKIGDLVFFKTGGGNQINHVGIYLWDGKMAHASSKRGVIVVTWIGDPYWEKRFVTARRIIDF